MATTFAPPRRANASKTVCERHYLQSQNAFRKFFRNLLLSTPKIKGSKALLIVSKNVSAT